jgi:hypothetical protein
MTLDFKHMNEAAEAAEGSEFTQFGKLTVSLLGRKKWIRDADGEIVGRPVDITESEWDSVPKNDRFTEVQFSIDVQEFNPNLKFVYERKVSIMGGKKSDWAKTVKPSIDKVFGKGKTLDQLSGLYVEAREVPQIRDDEYNTIEFKRVFKNRDEAFAAYNAKTGGGASSAPSAAPASTGDIPPGYTKDAWEEHMIPAIKKEHSEGKPAAAISSLYGLELHFVEAAIDA